MNESDPEPAQGIELGELHDATLDLVAAAECGDADAVLRQLLRGIVGTGLSVGASVWLRPDPAGRWIRHRSLGASGSWDLPSELENEHRIDGSTGALPDARGERLVVALAEAAALVAHRTACDLDGAREDREDAIECLTLLAASLLEPWTGRSASDGPAAPLPRG